MSLFIPTNGTENVDLLKKPKRELYSGDDHNEYLKKYYLLFREVRSIELDTMVEEGLKPTFMNFGLAKEIHSILYNVTINLDYDSEGEIERSTLRLSEHPNCKFPLFRRSRISRLTKKMGEIIYQETIKPKTPFTKEAKIIFEGGHIKEEGCYSSNIVNVHSLNLDNLSKTYLDLIFNSRPKTEYAIAGLEMGVLDSDLKPFSQYQLETYNIPKNRLESLLRMEEAEKRSYLTGVEIK